jgi:NTE family protein
LFLRDTNVRPGKLSILRNAELSADVVLASACLPNVFKAVEIDGEAYWDGGYMGNPAIYPLIYHGASRDVVIVHINPLERKELPVSSAAIFNRINEISFNSSLMREMRAIAFVTRLIDDGALDAQKYHRMLVHSISNDEEMGKLDVATKFNPDWTFLCHLRDAGRASAALWLDKHFVNVGERSSIDVGEVFL